MPRRGSCDRAGPHLPPLGRASCGAPPPTSGPSGRTTLPLQPCSPTFHYPRLCVLGQWFPSPLFSLYYLYITPSIYLLHLSKNFFSKSLLRISLGPWVWLLVHVAHLALIGCSLSAFIAPWLFISCDFLATPCLKCKLASFYCSLVIAPKANTMETCKRRE